MKIVGQRDDGVVLVDLGPSRYAVNLKQGCMANVTDTPHDTSSTEWREVPRAEASDIRHTLVTSMDRYVLRPYDLIADTQAKHATYARLLSETTLPVSLDQKSEHPFTYCMEVVVPAMEKQGKGPDDPKEFCGWWKAQQEK